MLPDLSSQNSIVFSKLTIIDVKDFMIEIGNKINNNIYYLHNFQRNNYIPKKKTIDSLLNKFIMFSNTMDRLTIRMYLSMEYKIIFKYKDSFCILDTDNFRAFRSTLLTIDDILQFKPCSKQDIKNYFYFERNQRWFHHEKLLYKFIVTLDSDIWTKNTL